MKRCAVFLSVLLLASAAHADDPKVRAKEAYARGLAAHDARDYPAAARAFAEADAILPSGAALGAALDAAVLADDPVLGAELLERSERPGATPELTKSIAGARAKLGGRAGKIRLVCPAGATCSALIDERSTTRELWVSAGTHNVTTRVDTTMKEQTIEVRPGETVVLSPEKPPPVTQPVAPIAPAPSTKATSDASSSPKATRKGLPPIVTYAGAGISLAMAGGAIAAGVLTKNRHDDFVNDGCDRGPGPDCRDLRDEGLALMIGTNVFWGLSALSAVATTVIAIGFTDWNASVVPTSNGAMLGLGRSF